MSVYMTEEEQLDAIKKWWNKYSTLITVMVSVILLGISAWKYWNWHEEKVMTEASNAYEHLMVAYANQDNKSIQAYANQLNSDFSHTIYAHISRMILAKTAVQEKRYDDARKVLDEVVSDAPLNALREVARIRVARLYMAEKKYDLALEQLKTVDDVAYQPVINELTGDIFAATGRYKDAVESYKQALSEVRTRGLGNVYLEMKTNELAGLTDEVSTSAKNRIASS